MGNVVCCSAVRRPGAKIDGDAIQRVRIRNLRAAIAGRIRTLRAAASRDGIVAAAALKGVVYALLDLNILSVIRAALIEADRNIDVSEIGAANRFD